MKFDHFVYPRTWTTSNTQEDGRIRYQLVGQLSDSWRKEKMEDYAIAVINKEIKKLRQGLIDTNYRIKELQDSILFENENAENIEKKIIELEKSLKIFESK